MLTEFKVLDRYSDHLRQMVIANIDRLKDKKSHSGVSMDEDNMLHQCYVWLEEDDARIAAVATMGNTPK